MSILPLWCHWFGGAITEDAEDCFEDHDTREEDEAYNDYINEEAAVLT